MRLWQYAEECEGTEIWDYLKEVWRCMREAVTRGLETEGTFKRRFRRAAQSENASTVRITSMKAPKRAKTALCAPTPTPSAKKKRGRRHHRHRAHVRFLRRAAERSLYMQERRGFTDTEILHALAAGGIIGNLIKTNASISGAGVRLSGGDRQRMFHGAAAASRSCTAWS